MTEQKPEEIGIPEMDETDLDEKELIELEKRFADTELEKELAEIRDIEGFRYEQCHGLMVHVPPKPIKEARGVLVKLLRENQIPFSNIRTRGIFNPAIEIYGSSSDTGNYSINIIKGRKYTIHLTANKDGGDIGGFFKLVRVIKGYMDFATK